MTFVDRGGDRHELDSGDTEPRQVGDCRGVSEAGARAA